MALPFSLKSSDIKQLIGKFFQVLGLGVLATGSGLSLLLYLGIMTLSFPLLGAMLIGLAGLMMFSIAQMASTKKKDSTKATILKVIAVSGIVLSALVMIILSLALLASLGFAAILNGVGIAVLILGCLAGITALDGNGGSAIVAFGSFGIGLLLVLTAAFAPLLFVGPGIALGVMLGIALVGLVAGIAIQPFYKEKELKLGADNTANNPNSFAPLSAAHTAQEVSSHDMQNATQLDVGATPRSSAPEFTPVITGGATDKELSTINPATVPGTLMNSSSQTIDAKDSSATIALDTLTAVTSSQ